MNNNALRFSLIGIIIGSLITYFVISVNQNSSVNAMMGMMGFRRNNALTQNNRVVGSMDRHFIEQMIPHHEDAITMAQIALDKAKRPEIRSLAEAIIKAQTEENTQMKAWYQEWYGQVVPQGDTQMGMHGMMGQNGMHMGMMGNETDMESLENAADFDGEFIRQMIPHHQMAIMMASMLEAGTTRDEMKQLAQSIIEAQTQEINQMRSWYNEWYQ
jgi:uncharacterized protein (DUF305 family)